jgi:hypothetical protein
MYLPRKQRTSIKQVLMLFASNNGELRRPSPGMHPMASAAAVT